MAEKATYYVQVLEQEATSEMRLFDTENKGNNNGYLEADELARVCEYLWPTRFGPPMMPMPNLTEYMPMFDIDGDKRWNVHEMALWWYDEPNWPYEFFYNSSAITLVEKKVDATKILFTKDRNDY